MNTGLKRPATAVTALTAAALGLSAQAAELDDSAAMLTGTIHFGGAAPTAQLQLQSVARSTRFDQTVPLGGLHWDSRTGLAPSVLGVPLTAAPTLNAAATDADGSGWSWVGWTLGGLAVGSYFLLREFGEAFAEAIILMFTPRDSDDSREDADNGGDNSDDQDPCEPGPLSPVIGSGCR